jgi:hypothetical protein
MIGVVYQTAGTTAAGGCEQERQRRITGALARL